MTDAGQRPSLAAEIQADLRMLQVTPDNVLLISNALRAEATLLTGKIHWAKGEAVVGKPGQDPVSVEAVPRLNTAITTRLTECQSYADALVDAADQMAQTARRYGHTEQEIIDSFTRYQNENPPPTTPTVS